MRFWLPQPVFPLFFVVAHSGSWQKPSESRTSPRSHDPFAWHGSCQTPPQRVVVVVVVVDVVLVLVDVTDVLVLLVDDEELEVVLVLEVLVDVVLEVVVVVWAMRYTA